MYGMQGMTEEEAVKKNVSFDVYSHTFSRLCAHFQGKGPSYLTASLQPCRHSTFGHDK
jgi:hypothetical protein